MFISTSGKNHHYDVNLIVIKVEGFLSLSYLYSQKRIFVFIILLASNFSINIFTSCFLFISRPTDKLRDFFSLYFLFFSFLFLSVSYFLVLRSLIYRTLQSQSILLTLWNWPAILAVPTMHYKYLIETKYKKINWRKLTKCFFVRLE